VRVIFKITYSILILSFLLFYFGCSASSSSTRYGKSGNDENHPSGDGYIVVGDDSISTNIIDDLNDSGDLPSDDEVDLSEVIKKYDNSNTGEILKSDAGTAKEKMLMEIIRYLNTPYKYGGNSKKGIDCSAFTQQVYRNVLSVELSRSARTQFRQGKKIKRIEDLRFGDLVFFNTRKNVKPGHVGIYIGDYLFAHASSSRGVTVSSLKHSYYKSRFMGGRRIEADGTF